MSKLSAKIYMIKFPHKVTKPVGMTVGGSLVENFSSMSWFLSLTKCCREIIFYLKHGKKFRVP